MELQAKTTVGTARGYQRDSTLTPSARAHGSATSIARFSVARGGCFAVEGNYWNDSSMAGPRDNRTESVSSHPRGDAIASLGFIGTLQEIEVVAGQCRVFEDAARRGGYRTVAGFNQDPDFEDHLLQAMRDRGVSGIVVEPVGARRNNTLRRMIREGFPVVTFQDDANLDVVSNVAMDYTTGGYLQGKHLVESGRRRICQVTRGGPFGSVVQRLNGLRRALEEAGATAAMTAILRADAVHFHHTDERDYHDLRRFIREHRGGFDAIVGTNDEYALCAMRAAMDEGLRIPDDIAVVGFDDIAACRSAPVGLTTVQHSSAAMAQRAFELISELVEGTRRAGDVERITLRPRLIIRGSTTGNPGVEEKS